MEPPHRAHFLAQKMSSECGMGQDEEESPATWAGRSERTNAEMRTSELESGPGRRRRAVGTRNGRKSGGRSVGRSIAGEKCVRRRRDGYRRRAEADAAPPEFVARPLARSLARSPPARSLPRIPSPLFSAAAAADLTCLLGRRRLRLALPSDVHSGLGKCPNGER